MEENNLTNQQIPIQNPFGEQQKVLSDVVELPSKGVFYPDMEYISELNVSYMTTKDEMIILTPGLMKSGKAFDVLLSKKILTKINNMPFPVDRLLPGDKLAILLFLRMTAYGTDYNIKVYSPYTFEYQEHVINLEKLKNKYFTFPLNDKNRIEKKLKNGDVLEIIIPDSGIEKLLEQESEKFEKNTGINEYPLRKLYASIVSVNGNEDSTFIRNYINNLRPIETRNLRVFLNEIEPGIDTEYEFICQSTGNPFREKIAIGGDLFYQ